MSGHVRTSLSSGKIVILHGNYLMAAIKEIGENPMQGSFKFRFCTAQNSSSSVWRYSQTKETNLISCPFFIVWVALYPIPFYHVQKITCKKRDSPSFIKEWKVSHEHWATTRKTRRKELRTRMYREVYLYRMLQSCWQAFLHIPRHQAVSIWDRPCERKCAMDFLFLSVGKRENRTSRRTLSQFSGELRILCSSGTTGFRSSKIVKGSSGWRSNHLQKYSRLQTYFSTMPYSIYLSNRCSPVLLRGMMHGELVEAAEVTSQLSYE